MDEFQLPQSPDELWAPDCELAYRCEAFVDLAGSSADEVGEIAENLAFVLCDQDPLCIVEQQNFDQLCSLVAAFGRVQGAQRRQLIDSLCSSLTCLNAWADKLLATPADSLDPDSVRQHRSAFKAYVFFLAWISSVAGRESREAAPTSAPATSGAASSQAGGRGRKKKAAAGGELGAWDWSALFPRVVKAVAQSLNTDLWALFRPSAPDEAVLMKAMQLASSALEDPACVKCEEQAANAAHILAMAALKYQQLDNVTAVLVDVLTKYEHAPVLVAGTLRYTIQQWDDGRLASAVIGELAAVDPAEYERQQNASGEKAGVRSVAAFVKEMAAQLPRLMSHQIALLLPHLGGKAYSLRSAIVHAIGSLLHKAFDSNSATDAADAQGALVRLRNKQTLLDLLCERTRDHSSYTRMAVLQVWEYLAEHRAIPLGHWQVVTGIAAGRLEDKSSLVRKEALKLLQALMLHNPFGPKLPLDRFDKTLAEHRAMLDQLLPGGAAPAPGAAGDALQQGLDVKPLPAEGAAEAAADAEGDERQQPGQEGSAEGMEVDGEVAQTGQTAADSDEEEQEGQPALPTRSPAEVGFDGSLEELQALVASLAMAVAFSKSIAGCMPTITQLLASSSISDVQESIAMLLTCKQFEVDGAADTIRKMLPLIFSKDQAIKDRIVEALDQLYINGWSGSAFSPAQAARNLIDLATVANLGELGSLEEVVHQFITKQYLRPVMLHELWDVASRAFQAMQARSAGAERAHRDLRAALAVLSMAAATRPEAFTQQQVEDLLRFGFSATAPDALITRHACVTLQRLAGNCKAGTYDGILPQIFAALTRVVVASPLPEAGWYSAAESALTAIYALHTAPEHLSAAMLKHMATSAFAGTAPAAGAGAEDGAARSGNGGGSSGMDVKLKGAPGDSDGTMDTGDGPAGSEGEEQEQDGGAAAAAEGPAPAASEPAALGGASQQPQVMHSVAALSRFFFALGHVALQHLVFIERAAKGVRRSRMEREKRAAEERAERMAAGRTPGGAEDDINAELGVGSVAADAELDNMKEQAEGQILAARSLLGPYARLVSAMCYNVGWLLAADARLRGSALLALTKLMVVDSSFCEMRPVRGGHSNLDLLFTLVQCEGLEASLRSNLIIALGDLALRFPNVLEPYTEFMYRPLTDPHPAVRKNTLMVLTHLILNDMMKVKGHIAKMALCLEDGEPRIAALAQLFFHELAKKEYKGTSPIYNLLPDILSNLSKEPALTKPCFQSIMQHLLGYIKKDKQGDSLIDKLCQRFAASDDPAQWHSIAFCLTQLPFSDKGMKKLSESFRHYKHALGDEEVAAAITSIIQKAKKGSNKQELKAEIEGFELKIAEFAQERADEEKTAEEARQHAEGRAAAAVAADGAASAQPSEVGAAADTGEVSAMRRQLDGMLLEGEEAQSGRLAAGMNAAAEEAEVQSGEMSMSADGGSSEEEQEGVKAPASAPAAQPAVSEQLSGTAVKVKPDPDTAAAEAEREAEQQPRRARGQRKSAAAAAAKPVPAGRANRRRAAVVDDSEAEEEEEEAAASAEQQEPQQEQEAAAANRGGGRARGRGGGGKVAALAAKLGGDALTAAVAEQEAAVHPAKGARRSGRRSALADAADVESGGIAAVRVKDEPRH